MGFQVPQTLDLPPHTLRRWGKTSAVLADRAPTGTRLLRASVTDAIADACSRCRSVGRRILSEQDLSTRPRARGATATHQREPMFHVEHRADQPVMFPAALFSAPNRGTRGAIRPPARLSTTCTVSKMFHVKHPPRLARLARLRSSRQSPCHRPHHSGSRFHVKLMGRPRRTDASLPCAIHPKPSPLVRSTLFRSAQLVVSLRGPLAHAPQHTITSRPNCTRLPPITRTRHGRLTGAHLQ